MPRQRAKAGGRENGGRGGGASAVKSDEEILKERKNLEVFRLADDFLWFLSLGCWALAVAWFLFFWNAAPAVPPSSRLPEALGAALGETCFVLMGCALFCGNLSKAGPRAAWSPWRLVWHVLWLPSLALISVAFARFGLSADPLAGSGSSAPLPPASYGKGLGVCLAALAVAALLTWPRGTPSETRASCSLWGRLMLRADGLLGLAFSVCMALDFDSWRHVLGPSALALSAMPLGMLSLGALLCRTDSELIGAVPAIMLICALGIVKVVYLNDLRASSPLCVAFGLHGALFLPLPWRDPDSNPFHVWLRRHFRGFARLLTSRPSSGWAEAGDEIDGPNIGSPMGDGGYEGSGGRAADKADGGCGGDG